MNDGKLIAQGNPEEIINNELVIETYIGSNYERYISQLLAPVEEASKISNVPLPITLLGERLVIYMHMNEPVVFKDLCIHRGAKLSGGVIDDSGSIQCPYHGWKFDREGNCISIPSMDASKKIPPTWCIHKYKAKISFGLIWVNLSEKPENISHMAFRCLE